MNSDVQNSDFDIHCDHIQLEVRLDKLAAVDDSDKDLGVADSDPDKHFAVADMRLAANTDDSAVATARNQLALDSVVVDNIHSSVLTADCRTVPNPAVDFAGGLRRI